MPESVSEERTALLNAFAQRSLHARRPRFERLHRRAKEMLAENPGKYYFPYQYGNDANPRAHYETTGPEILRDLPQTTVFVAGLGTGGTLTGTGRYLKDQKPSVRVIAAAPHPGDLVQGLRALEDGFIPPIFDETVLDGKIVVDSKSSFAMSKDLTTKEGLFVGISCGAVVRAAIKASERLEGEQHIVCLLADGAGSTSRPISGQRMGRQPGEVENKIWW